MKKISPPNLKMKTKTKKSTHKNTKNTPKNEKNKYNKMFYTIKKVKENYYIIMTFLHRKLL
jgi:hypothetical protein